MHTNDARILKGLVDRLCELHYPPKDPEARKDLTDAVDSARSEMAAMAAVNAWIKSYDRCPKPAQIRAFVEAENAVIAEKRGECILCDGTGFLLVTKGDYTGVKPCSCLPKSHLAQLGNDPHEHEYWKPSWKYPRTEAR